MKAPSANALVGSIPPEILADFAAQFEDVALAHNAILHDVGESVSHLYFPLTGVVSVFTIVENADPVENAVIGREGVAGTIALARVPAFARATVQIPGKALRMRTDAFLKLYGACPAFRTAILRFNASIIAQIQQNVACNILHDTKQRICRWLLHASDRMGSMDLSLTQEALAQSISAHRATVISAIGSLQQDGVIRHGRGKIRVIDHPRLLAYSCECYKLVQLQYAELLRQ